MQPNVEGKIKNPKAPDWKCTNATCKMKQVNGAWVASDFRTGVWDAPTNGSRPAAAVTPKTVERMKEVEDHKMEAITEYNDVKTKGMTVLNAKNGAAQITSALITAGLTTEVEETFKKYATFIYYFHPEEQPPF